MPNRESEWRRSERRWNRKTNVDGCQKQNPRQRGSTDKNGDIVDLELEDPEYKTFLRNLKEHDSFYKFVVYGDNGEPDEVVYETDDQLPVNQSTREEEGVQRSQRPGLEDVDDDDEEEEYLGFLNPDLRERDIDHGDSGDDAERDYVQLVNRIGGGTSRPPETRPVSGGDIVGEDCSEFEDKDLVGEDCNDLSDDDDETYLEFLGLLEKGSLGKFGDDDEDSDADTDVVLMEEGLHFEENSTPFVSIRSSQVIDVETYCPGNDATASNSRFKRELLECLEKPYDSKQHQEFKTNFECRKPQIEDRKLRGKEKTYESKYKVGKSYRDQHSDFAVLIDLAKNDSRRSLNLLRGFFYWMKNIAQVGAFKPWHDPLILKMLPEK